MTTYVFVAVGCRECGDPSELVMVTHDLEAVRSRWDEYTERNGRPAPFEVRNWDYEPWPSNVVALETGGSYAWVVYADGDG